MYLEVAMLNVPQLSCMRSKLRLAGHLLQSNVDIRIWTPPVLQAFSLRVDGTTAHVYPACVWALDALAIMGYSRADSLSP